MGETFAGFNKPNRAPKGSKKKFVVLGKQGDKIKKVSYGHRDYSDFRKHKREVAEMKDVTRCVVKAMFECAFDIVVIFKGIFIG